MKKIFSLVTAGLLLTSVATSCADADYDDKYADPSKTTTVGVPQVFTGILYKGNAWMNLMYYRYFTQSTTSGIFSGVVGDSNTRGRFRGAGEGYFNTRWMDYYDMLTQYRLLEYTYKNLSENEKPANLVFYYLGRTLVEAQLHEVLSLWGDVPFNGAGTLWQNGDFQLAKDKCVYDDDVALYKQILADLKEVGDYFAGNEVSEVGLTSLARQDYTTAAGSKELWQKYVNSLRLRIAMHLSTNGDCVTEAHTAIKEILENPSTYPLIDENTENMGVAADTQSDDFNFGKSLSQALRTGDYATASQTVLNVLNVPANGIPDKNTDPRLEVMYDCNPDGAYISFDVTKTNAQITQIEDENRQRYIQAGMLTANYYCEIDSQAVAGWDTYQGNENIMSPWVTAAEVSLNKAEAYLMGYGVAADKVKAKESFVKGVRLSIDYYWDMKETSTLYKNGNDSYNAFRPLAKRPSESECTAYAEGIWDETQQTVCEQLWLNFSFMNELEAWNVVRRTGFPVVTFSKDTQVSSYPTPPNRLPYPSDELSYNTANCQDAIKKNYEEETGYYTNLFWAKKVYYKLLEK